MRHRATRRTSIAVIHRALDLGMTLIDTADVYGPYTNEELVGRALRRSPRPAVLATKVGLVARSATGGTHGRGGTAARARPAAIDASLRRLGTDHVDLYQLHRVDPQVPIEETWGAMAEARGGGQGAAHRAVRGDASSEIGRAQAVHPVARCSPSCRCGPGTRWPRCCRTASEQGIAFLPFSPLGPRLPRRAVLLVRRPSPQDDFRRGLPRFQQEAHGANLAIVDQVAAVAERAGATPAQVALAWVLAQGDTWCPSPAPRRVSRLEDNAGAADMELSAEDLAELDALPAPARLPLLTARFQPVGPGLGERDPALAGRRAGRRCRRRWPTTTVPGVRIEGAVDGEADPAQARGERRTRGRSALRRGWLLRPRRSP